MSEFFKTSVIWVVDFRYDGRPQRWFKAFGASEDMRQPMVSQLQALYGDRAQLVEADMGASLLVVGNGLWLLRASSQA